MIYLRKYGANAKPAKAQTKLTTGRKTSAYIFTIPMLLSLVSMFVITAEYVRWTGGK